MKGLITIFIISALFVLGMIIGYAQKEVQAQDVGSLEDQIRVIFETISNTVLEQRDMVDEYSRTEATTIRENGSEWRLSISVEYERITAPA